ncbi:MAG: glutaredoxin family protein [Betaproteobacteria bacterium]|nr:glutaredoxin family protein [Betaproteobacteria bacterium]
MKKIISGLFACLAMCVLASGASAEVYRWVDPATGKTVYSDKPPPGTVKGVVRSGSSRPAEEKKEDSKLSFEMQEAARKFPVLLYSAPDSEFSNEARALLSKRGIPFRENVIQTEDEVKAMKNLTGDTTIPTLYVGRQSVRGFNAEEFNRILDLAGYPKDKKQAEEKSGEGS